MLNLTFATDNAAFNGEPIYETARLLRYAARKIEAGEYEGTLMDINGNNVGGWTLDRREEEETS